MKNKILSIAILAFSFAFSQGAMAASVTQKWVVTDAQTSDRYDNHGLWTNVLGADENEKRHSFQSGSMLTEYDDGTAHLMATAKNRHDRTATINIWFGQKESNTEYMGPIKTVGGNDTSDWHFYKTVLKGSSITFDTETEPYFVGMVNGGNGPVLQIGTGANDKNGAFGASTWLDIFLLQELAIQEEDFQSRALQAELVKQFGNKHWDLNMNLTAVPVPAAVWLFGSALMGFVGMRKKAKQA